MLHSGIENGCLIVFSLMDEKLERIHFYLWKSCLLYLKCALLLLRSYNKAFISPCVHKCFCVCVCNKINTPLGCVFISSFLFPSGIGIHNQILRRRSRIVKYNGKRFTLDLGFHLTSVSSVKLCCLEEVT